MVTTASDPPVLTTRDPQQHIFDRASFWRLL